MSNILKRKKKKKNTYSIKIGRVGEFCLQRDLRNCNEKLFRSLQLCSWYVLYAPEYLDWNYEKLKRFSEVMGKNNEKYGNHTEKYKKEVFVLSEKIGIDLRKISALFPYRAKIKMYGREPRADDLKITMMCISDVFESSLFLIIYSLHHDFCMSESELKDKFLQYLVEISSNYANGMTDEHLMKYFKEIEDWDIYDSLEGDILYEI